MYRLQSYAYSMNEVSFSSQHITTVDHFCLLLGICKKNLGAFFLKKTHTSIISVEHHTDVLQKENIQVKISFFNGRILPMGKNSRCCCMRTWQHLSWKKIPQQILFQAQKNKISGPNFLFRVSIHDQRPPPLVCC